MIAWMLARLEHDPHAVFYEKELVEQFPDEFEKARAERLLRRVPQGSTYSYGLPRPRVLVDCADGTFEAWDDEDPEADPVVLTAAELRRWQLSLKGLALKLRQANGLMGEPGSLGDRLFFIGETLRDGLHIAFVLCLFHVQDSALRDLKMLPGALPRRFDRFVAVCPSFRPAPAEQQLELFGIFVVSLDGVDPFILDYSCALAKPVRRVPPVILSQTEEQEFLAQGFKSRTPIHITGRMERRKGNIIEIGGHDVILTDAPFRMLLRLVVALYESEGGFLSRDGIRYGTGVDGEMLLAPEGLDQALGRLRRALEPAFHGLKGTQLIEVRDGRVRLSTHHRYITWDGKTLLQHEDKLVRALAKRLPKASAVGG